MAETNAFTFSNYSQLGIWGIVAEFCHKQKIENWAIRYRFGEEYTSAYPTLAMQNKIDFFSSDNLADVDSQEKKIIWNEKKRIVYLFVDYQEKEYFVVAMSFPEISFSLIETLLNDFHHYLHLLLAYELSLQIGYPSYFPLLYFPEQEFSSVNTALQNRNVFYFLNGQKGTGKELFVNRFALYHFGYRLPQAKDSLSAPEIYNFKDIKGKSIELWFVAELAILEPQWQEKIAAEISNVPTSGKEIFIFVSSIYSSKALLDGNLLTESLYRICEKNRVLFPSLSRRRFELKKIIIFVASFTSSFFANHSTDIQKIDDAEIEYLIRQIDKGKMQENFDSLYRQFFASKTDVSLYKEIQERSLDELTGDLEKKAIRLAYEAVGHSQQKIANYLGISRGSLQYKIRQHEIPYQTWESK